MFVTLLIFICIRDWSLITGRGGYKTGGGGAREVLILPKGGGGGFAEEVLAMLKGGGGSTTSFRVVFTQ